jgi:hypothetical protein
MDQLITTEFVHMDTVGYILVVPCIAAPKRCKAQRSPRCGDPRGPYTTWISRQLEVHCRQDSRSRPRLDGRRSLSRMPRYSLDVLLPMCTSYWTKKMNHCKGLLPPDEDGIECGGCTSTRLSLSFAGSALVQAEAGGTRSRRTRS